mgnify:FL=1|tara:strand:- start:1941 stop:2627 length:687 start_codon:yes stop_codon:yes gene_type:complete
MTNLTSADLDVLTQWDTPTICNALEITNPERRSFGYNVKPLTCLDPSLPPMIGYARTAKIRAAAPATVSADRLEYYEYVATGATPTIVVIEDVDPSPGYGAFWGEVQTNVHKGLGAKGCVTNGCFRDVTDSAAGFQLLGGMVNPSHAHVHLIDINCPVNVHGMEVVHDDIIHADLHGAVVVPGDAVKKIPDAVDLLIRREAVILEAAKAPGFNFEKLKAAIGTQADIH